MNEVSCRVMWLHLETARQHQVPLERLVEGLPFTVDHIKNPGNRIDWDHFCILNERLQEISGGPSELERSATLFSQAPIFWAAQSVFGLLTSAKTVYWASHKWFGHAMFTIVGSSFEELEGGRIRFTMTIPDGYRECPEFFRINAGVFRCNPRVLGQPDASVEYELLQRKAIYIIDPPPSLTLWARLRRAFGALFSAGFALKELGQQQEQLKSRYVDLSTAHTQIAAQASQLTTVNLLARQLTAFTELIPLAQATAQLLTERFRASAVSIAIEPAPGQPLKVLHAVGGDAAAPDRTLALSTGGQSLGKVDLWGPTVAGAPGDLLDDLAPWIAISLENARSFALLREYKEGLELKVAERTVQLEHSLQKVTEADRLKTEFFGNASHELRTPLTLMLAPLEVLAASKDLSAEARAELSGVARSGYKLLKLVNDLLDLSKIEAGKMTLTMGAVDLVPLLNEILRPWGAAMRARKITLTTQLDGTLPLAGDGERLEQVALNLLSNAIKFTPDGGTIEVRAGKNDGGLYFSVQNSGEGMPADELPNLFGRFTQSTRSKSRRFGSTGLGLPVVRELVELHGGTIEAQSELGSWVRFTVQLPVGQIEDGAATVCVRPSSAELQLFDAAAHRENSAAASPLAVAAEAGLDLPTLVVAEDNEALRGFVVKNLASTFRVIEAGDGAQALRLIRQHQPDVILSDLMMPELDGLELCAAVKADPSLSNIPFVLLTARADIDTRLNGFDKGADDYLMKPFHLEELRARLNAQLRLRKLATQMAQREKLAALGAVVAGVAHEIRNPLNGIINALEPLKELMPDASPELLELIDLAIQSSKRVEYVSDQLLKQGRAGEGTRGDVDLTENVRLALQLLSHKVGSGVELTSELTPTESVNVVGEAGALHQVWVNLIDNAIQAASPSGSVKVSVTRTNGHATVVVSDTGKGIEPRVLKRIWDPFFTTKDVGSGTGLGLAIVKEIVEKHGGQISVDSTVGHGARFTVRLPHAVPNEGGTHVSH